MQKKTFSLLVFHGSARKNANDAANEFSRILSAELGCSQFSLCFLKGVAPELSEAIATAAANGEKHLTIIPLFLLPGSHINDDIPAIVRDFSSAHPEVEIVIRKCLVAEEDFAEYVARQIKISNE